MRFPLWFLVVFAVVLAGCNLEKATETAKVVAIVAEGGTAVKEARQTYETAVLALQAEKDKFPPEVQEQLLDIKAKADTLISLAEQRVNDKLNTIELVTGDGELFYNRLTSLYRKAKKILAPHKKDLDVQTLWALEDLALNIDKMESARALYQNNPSARNAQHVAEFAVEGVRAGSAVISVVGKVF